MTTIHKKTEEQKKPGFFTKYKRFVRWLIPLVIIVGGVFLAAWLAQRALNSNVRQRAFQDWLDENLNADVSLLSYTRLRLNLLRNSRFYVRNLEVEHPTPLFPGKFFTLGEMIARVPFYSFYRLKPGVVALELSSPKVQIEQGEGGEWSFDGLMRPLSARTSEFPYPMPLFSGFKAKIRDGELAVRRRGFELKFSVNAEVETSKDSRRLVIRAPNIPFVFTHMESGQELTGSFSIPAATVLFELDGDTLRLRPDNSEVRVNNLPAAALPFFFGRMPLEAIPGFFTGLARFYEDSDKGNWVKLEGKVADAPLAAFGLPRSAPLKMDLPYGESDKERTAVIRLGPSGFGGFDIHLPIGSDGRTDRLDMQCDVVSLEDLSASFVSRRGWSAWLPALISNITWNARQWRGYGWEGNNLSLAITKSASGLNALAEADLFDGKARSALTLGQGRETVITTAAEKIDARQFATRISRVLPPAWQVSITGGKGNLTWRGTLPQYSDGKGYWAFNVVLAKSTIDLANSGPWWQIMTSIPKAIADELPRWGGGDSQMLLDIAALSTAVFEQLSVVSDWEEGLGTRVDYVAHIDGNNEMRGWIEFTADGEANGEARLANPTVLLEAVAAANSEYGEVLSLLSRTGDGLRTTFTFDPEEGLEFMHPFLQDALRLREEIDSVRGNTP